MKALSIKSLSIVFGAIALISTPLSFQSRAEDLNCSVPLGGIELNEQQAKEYQNLNDRLEADLAKVGAEYERRLEAILPANSTQDYETLDAKKKGEFEAATAQNNEQVGAAEAVFTRGLKQLLTPEQRQYLERWDAACNFAAP